MEKSLCKQRSGADRRYLDGAQDIHEASIAFQRAVRDMYLSETVRDPRFLRIGCEGADGEMLPPEEIFAKVKSTVDSFLQ